MNFPGSVHDSTMANMSGVYEILESIHDRTGSKISLDGAFNNRQSDAFLKDLTIF